MDEVHGKTSLPRRLRGVFQRLDAMPDGVALWQAWATALDHPAADNWAACMADVSRQLAEIHTQLSHLEKDLVRQTQLTNETVGARIARLQEIVKKHAVNLSLQWGTQRGSLTKELLASFEFWDALTPAAERELSAEQTAELRALLESCRNEVEADTSVSRPMRQLFLAMLRRLEQAILDYPIAGPDALMSALLDVRVMVGRGGNAAAEATQSTKAGSAILRAYAGFAAIVEPIIHADEVLSAFARAKEVAGLLLTAQ